MDQSIKMKCVFKMKLCKGRVACSNIVCIGNVWWQNLTNVCWTWKGVKCSDVEVKLEALYLRSKMGVIFPALFNTMRQWEKHLNKKKNCTHTYIYVQFFFPSFFFLPHFIILSVVIDRIFSFIFVVFVRFNYYYADDSLSDTPVERVKDKHGLKFYF